MLSFTLRFPLMNILTGYCLSAIMVWSRSSSILCIVNSPCSWRKTIKVQLWMSFSPTILRLCRMCTLITISQTLMLKSMDKIEKPASLIEKENLIMATTITQHFMKVLNCKDVNELIETCETIIKAVKQTHYYLAKWLSLLQSC